MIKQVLALIVLSIGIIFAMPYAQHAMQYLLLAHDWVLQILADVFSDGQAGNLAKSLIALLTIPVLIALIPSLIYWMARRTWFPFFMEVVWVVWLIQAGALMAQEREHTPIIVTSPAAPEPAPKAAEPAPPGAAPIIEQMVTPEPKPAPPTAPAAAEPAPEPTAAAPDQTQ